jgi:hypothetical protein
MIEGICSSIEATLVGSGSSCSEIKGNKVSFCNNFNVMEIREYRPSSKKMLENYSSIIWPWPGYEKKLCFYH